MFLLEMKKTKIKFITPIFNDWENLEKVIKKIKLIYEKLEYEVELIVINDCSTTLLNKSLNCSPLKITIINLNKNSGSQKAIAIGIKYIDEKQIDCDYVVVMDSDGEDKPEDTLKLIEASSLEKKIIFAKRKKRNENFFFKFFYFIYKISFKLLTGETIDFGNFSCIPSNFIKKVVLLDDLDLHFAVSIVKSKLEYKKINCDKGFREFGTTKLRFHKHLLHGLISLSIFSEVIAVNIFFSSILGMLFTVFLSLTVVISKIFFSFTLLGWTSIILVSLLILFIILFLLCIFSLIILLNKNNYNKNISKNLIKSVESQ
jgi:hypothetical protein